MCHDDVIKWKHFLGTGPLCWEFTGHRWISLKRPVTQRFDVFFDLRLNKRLSKQSRRRWFETPSCSLWRHCNALTIYIVLGVALSIRYHIISVRIQVVIRIRSLLLNRADYIVFYMTMTPCCARHFQVKGSQLWDYLQSISSYITPSWIVVILMGMFWQRATEQVCINDKMIYHGAGHTPSNLKIMNVWVVYNQKLSYKWLPLSSNESIFYVLSQKRLQVFKCMCNYFSPLDMITIFIFMHILQYMGKIFCLEFQWIRLIFQTNYLTHALKYAILYSLKMKTSQI